MNIDDEEEIKEAIKIRIKELVPKHITLEDIFASISYIFNLEYGIGNIDDIDHLRKQTNYDQLVNYYKTNSELVYQEWKELLEKE